MFVDGFKMENGKGSYVRQRFILLQILIFFMDVSMIRVFEFKCIASLSGQFMCGSKQCHEIEGLASYEACIFRKFLNYFFLLSVCV